MNPCDDFYRFSCGNYLKIQNVDDGAVSPFVDIEKRLHFKLRKILEGLNETDEEGPEFRRQLKIFYNQCMDLGNIVRWWNSEQCD